MKSEKDKQRIKQLKDAGLSRILGLNAKNVSDDVIKFHKLNIRKDSPVHESFQAAAVAIHGKSNAALECENNIAIRIRSWIRKTVEEIVEDINSADIIYCTSKLIDTEYTLHLPVFQFNQVAPFSDIIRCRTFVKDICPLPELSNIGPGGSCVGLFLPADPSGLIFSIFDI